ncbi:MAG: F0F1 ATP synthase subunit epsilon [Anaerolineae bacterium]
MSAEASSGVLLRILTPERATYDGPVQWAQVPLEDGLLGVWPGHAPLVATVAEGVITFLGPDGESQLPVGRGVLLIDGTHCVVLVSDLGPQTADTGLDGIVGEMEAALDEALEDDQLQSILEAQE